MVELLAPAGDTEKLKTALHFGADAVYAGGGFSLRADKSMDNDLEDAILLAHGAGKKFYAAVNIYANDADFPALSDYIKRLDVLGADGVIAADPGVISLIRKTAENMPVHVSTQANTTNSYAAAFWADMGVKRIVTAREMSLENIKRMRDILPDNVEIECFVHGAMCISYSGRCLLSDYLTGRGSNRGDCAQPCRWEYTLTAGGDTPLTIGESERGSYILNSADMCMIEHLKELKDAGVYSFKIEGRMKTRYYCASAVSAYRAAIDAMEAGRELPDFARAEVEKHSHRAYSTGFYFGAAKVSYQTSRPAQEYDFVGIVLGREGGEYIVEQRGRFACGQALETLCADAENTARTFTLEHMRGENGAQIFDAKLVREKVRIVCPVPLKEGDMLRRRRV